MVIVSPRIMLTYQLFFEIEKHIDTGFIHTFVYSGDSVDRSEEMQDYLEWQQLYDVKRATTFPEEIALEHTRSLVEKVPHLIMTTYHSLNRVNDSNVPLGTVYLDEAHNAVSLQFSHDVARTSELCSRMYSFTATPKDSQSDEGRGNNNKDVFGKIICEISPGRLINSGCIVPPMISQIITGINRNDNHETRIAKDVIKAAVSHCEEFHGHINHKILVAANGSVTIDELRQKTDLQAFCDNESYHLFLTTSKYGSWYNGEEMTDRQDFLDKLKEIGSDESKKLIVVHHSILSEGIDVPGLTAALLLRNMNKVVLLQTVGRILRMLPSDRRAIFDGEIRAGDYMNYKKQYALIMLPMYNDDGPDMRAKLERTAQYLLEGGIRPRDLLADENVGGKEEIQLPDVYIKNPQQIVKSIAAKYEWLYREDAISKQFSSIVDFFQ